MYAGFVAAVDVCADRWAAPSSSTSCMNPCPEARPEVIYQMLSKRALTSPGHSSGAHRRHRVHPACLRSCLERVSTCCRWPTESSLIAGECCGACACVGTGTLLRFYARGGEWTFIHHFALVREGGVSCGCVGVLPLSHSQCFLASRYVVQRHALRVCVCTSCGEEKLRIFLASTAFTHSIALCVAALIYWRRCPSRGRSVCTRVSPWTRKVVWVYLRGIRKTIFCVVSLRVKSLRATWSELFWCGKLPYGRTWWNWKLHFTGRWWVVWRFVLFQCCFWRDFCYRRNRENLAKQCKRTVGGL